MIDEEFEALLDEVASTENYGLAALLIRHLLNENVDREIQDVEKIVAMYQREIQESKRQLHFFKEHLKYLRAEKARSSTAYNH